MAARAVQANVMFCELTGGSEKRARALLTGIVSGRCARDVTCESRVKVCPSTGFHWRSDFGQTEMHKRGKKLYVDGCTLQR